MFVNYLQGVASEGQAAQRALHQIESNTPVQESFREYVTYVANSPRLQRAANAPNNTPSTPTLAAPAESGAGGTPTPAGPNTPLAQYLPYMRTNPPQVNSAPPAARATHHHDGLSPSSSGARAPHTVVSSAAVAGSTQQQRQRAVSRLPSTPTAVAHAAAWT